MLLQNHYANIYELPDDLCAGVMKLSKRSVYGDEVLWWIGRCGKVDKLASILLNANAA